MNLFDFMREGKAYLEAVGRLDSNPLVQLALRREQRNTVLQAGYKRNAWVFLVCISLFILAIVVSVTVRTDNFSRLLRDFSEAFNILFMVIMIPVSLLWLLGGLFRLCRDSLGWLSQIKDSGGAQLLDSMICISPLDDRDIVMAGIRINVMPLWPRILFCSVILTSIFMLTQSSRQGEILMQGLMFMPLSIIALTVTGILGSILLGLYLFTVGLNMRFHLLVPLLAFMLAGLQIFTAIFGSIFFTEISMMDSLDPGIWVLVPIGLLAGLAIFIGTVHLTFSGSLRRTWLLVIIPVMLPVVISFLVLLSSIAGLDPDGQFFAAFFGNMMWVYNCFLPFSPFALPSVMLRGVPFTEAWNAMAFEFWRWPLMFAMQLILLNWLLHFARRATMERRTPLTSSDQ